MPIRGNCLKVAMCVVAMTLCGPGAADDAGTPPVDVFGDSMPQGAVARLGTVRFRHFWGTNSVCFSPDGKLLAAASSGRPGAPYSGAIALFDAGTGKQVRLIGGDIGQISCLAFSPDGKVLASGGNACEVQFWDVATGKPSRRIEFQDCGSIYALAFAPNGTQVLAASWKKGVGIWDVASGRPQGSFTGHKEEVNAVACSPDGKLVASGGAEKRIFERELAIANGEKVATVRLWSSASREEVRQFTAPTWSVRSVGFSPDGKWVIAGCYGDVISVWDVAMGREVRRFAGRAPSIAVSPDGAMLAAGGAGEEGTQPRTIRLWELATGKEIRCLPTLQDDLTSLAFSPDGRMLVAGSHPNVICLWDVATGKERFPAQSHQGTVHSLAFLPDGSLGTVSSDTTVRFWEASTGKEIRRWPGGQGALWYLAVSPDARLVATGGADRTVRVRESPTGKEWHRFADGIGWWQAACFSPDGQHLVTGDQKGTIRVRAVGTPEILRTVREGERCLQTAPVLSPDGKLLAACLNQRVRVDGYKYWLCVWETETGKKRVELEAWDCSSLAFSPDSLTLAVGITDVSTGNYQHYIRLWDVVSGKEVGRLSGYQPRLAFSPDGQTLASAERDAVIRLWEVRTGKERCQFRGHQGDIASLAWSPDGQRLASGSEDSTALVWDFACRSPEARTPKAPLPDGALAELWAKLAGDDAVAAYQAIGMLAAHPKQAVPFFKARLPLGQPTQIGTLIANLDSDTFAVREQASAELARLGQLAGPALRKVLARRPSPEVQQRVDALVQGLEEKTWPPETMRSLRAIEVLEHARSSDARALLEKLAGGDPESRLTQEARAALARLARRATDRP
jgi:WD40 repeat protein